MHKCDTCEKLHSSVPHIKDLLNMHAGDKTFKCVHVGMNFAIVGHLVIILTVTNDLKVLHVRACLVFDLIQREIC